MTSKFAVAFVLLVATAALARSADDGSVELPAGWDLDGNELVWNCEVPLRRSRND